MKIVTATKIIFKEYGFMLKVKAMVFLFLLIFAGTDFSFMQEMYGSSKIMGKLDGAEVVSLETFILPDKHGLSLGMDYYPFNPYYDGLTIAGSYHYYFTKNIAWELIRGSYVVLPVQTSLTSELAEEFGVNPEKIEKLKYVLKSNFRYFFLYGKSLLFDKHIRYYRLGMIIGPGMAFTTENTNFLANFGLGFEFYVTESVLWTFDFEDSVVVDKELETYPSFNLGFKAMF